MVNPTQFEKQALCGTKYRVLISTAEATGVRLDVALAQEGRGPFGGGSCLSGPEGTRVGALYFFDVTLLGIFRSFDIKLLFVGDTFKKNTRGSQSLFARVRMC